MAQKITVQDGKILYSSSDPTIVDIEMNILGKAHVTKEITVGGPDGIITTTPGTNLTISAGPGGALILISPINNI